MKIAYLTEWSPYAETGVLRKIIGQIATWRQLGCEASVFAIAPRSDEQPALNFSNYGTVYGHIHKRQLNRFPFARLGYVNKVISVPAVKGALNDYKPDLIYYRQNGPWYPGVEALLRIAPVVMEINTDETAENRFWGRAFSTLYDWSQPRVLARVTGFACVTHEIASKYQGLGKPVAVIPNGYWADAEGPLESTHNREPAFVFIGSVSGQASQWYGLDKIFLLARRMPKSKFHIVGFTANDFAAEAVPENLIFHGPQQIAEIKKIYEGCDLGISSLSLFFKGQHEACLLKTREYLMLGLPVILGYHETEERLRTAEYALNIGNYSNNVADNLERIEVFAKKWLRRRVTDDLSFMSGVSKEKDRLAFFDRVIASCDRDGQGLGDRL